MNETAVIIRATDEIKRLRKQSHGWHVMYKDAVIEIAELEDNLKKEREHTAWLELANIKNRASMQEFMSNQDKEGNE